MHAALRLATLGSFPAQHPHAMSTHSRRTQPRLGIVLLIIPCRLSCIEGGYVSIHEWPPSANALMRAGSREEP